MQGGENVRVIFGMKLRKFREQRGYSLKALAERTGLSPSYLTEIEKGKKYPKTGKILQLAEAVELPFDDLVSLKLERELNPLSDLLNSPLMQEFPFHLFGFTPQDVMNLVRRSPNEASTLIRTLGEIAGSYDMRVEHIFYAALRSYQESHHNSFEDLESAAANFLVAQEWNSTPPMTADVLGRCLTDRYGYIIDESTLETFPELLGFRSVWVDSDPPRLLLNARLLPAQKAFVLGRELGYEYLDLRDRAPTSSPSEVRSFVQVLNDFKASYFAGALLMNRDTLVTELREFFAQTRWNETAFLGMLDRYEVTQEMFLHRLSEIIPTSLELPRLHFLRLNNAMGSHVYQLTKHLNMSGLPLPQGLGLHEHYCRRWLSVRVLRELADSQLKGGKLSRVIRVQRSRFIDTEGEYFCISLARPLALTPTTNSSVTLGFPMDDAFKERVRFWDDPAIPHFEINETCERCSLSRRVCTDRAAPGTLYKQEKALTKRNQVLNILLDELRKQ